MVCIRCQKRPAIIFVQRMENGQMKNEGYCLHCARELHIKPVEDLMKQFGMSDEDMDNMEDRMENMMQELGDGSGNPFSENDQRQNVVTFEPTECDKVTITIHTTNGEKDVHIYEVRVYS